MTTRRSFLVSLLATASLPRLTWADAGGPSYLAAAKDPSGQFSLIGLTREGAEAFHVSLPARGHAGAGHPKRPEAVVFARRPGTFAYVIDCAFGRVSHDLTAPEGAHFSGHGTYSRDGTTLFTSEISNADGQGQIGLWDVENGYERVGEFASGGLGPHEILRLPDSDTIVVANGGIVTALDDDRSKLNINTMAPNLTYLSSDGDVLERVELPSHWHQNSIRHLSVTSDGLVGFAMQWEGDPAIMPPLLGVHKQGDAVVLISLPDYLAPRLKNYAASIAFSGDETRVAITCPRGGVMVSFDLAGQDPEFLPRADVCGISASQNGFYVTDGLGGVLESKAGKLRPLAVHDRAWDNHLVRI
ncbi:DUF1513 domain-containing protein [Pacificibacter maritimus]